MIFTDLKYSKDESYLSCPYSLYLPVNIIVNLAIDGLNWDYLSDVSFNMSHKVWAYCLLTSDDGRMYSGIIGEFKNK